MASPLVEVLLPAVRHGAAAIALAGLAVIVGHGLLPARARPASARLALPLAFVLGAFALGWTGWIAGSLAGLAAIPLAWALAALPGLVRIRETAALARRALRHQWLLARSAPLIAAGTLAAGLPLAVQLLLPLVDSDGLRYHVALPRLWLLEGRVTLYTWDVAGYLPHAAEVLYLAGLWLAGGETAKWLHFLAFLAALAALRSFLSRGPATRAAANLAPLFLIASVTAVVPAAAAFTDWWPVATLAAALLLLDRGGSNLALGAALGAAFAFKLSAAPVAAFLALVAIVRRGLGAAPRAAFAVLAPMTLAILPWGLRNLAVTGDPVFPVGHVLLGLPIEGLPPASLDYATRYHRVESGPLGFAWSAGLAGAAPDDVVGWHHLLGLFTLPLLARAAGGRWLLAVVVPSLVVRALYQPPSRYFLALFWALAASEGLALVAAARRPRWRRTALVAALVACAPGWWRSAGMMARQFHPLELLRGDIDRERFLATRVPGYLAARRVNGEAGPGRVMAMDFPAPGYLDHPWIAEGMLHEPPLQQWLVEAPDAASLETRLRAAGVRWLLVTPGYGGGTPDALLPLARSEREAAVVLELRARLRRLGEAGGVDIWELPPG